MDGLLFNQGCRGFYHENVIVGKNQFLIDF